MDDPIHVEPEPRKSPDPARQKRAVAHAERRRPRRTRRKPPRVIRWLAARLRELSWWQAILMLAALGLAIYTLLHQPVIVDSISVPPALSQLGYGSDVFRQEVLNVIDEIERETRTRHPRTAVSAPQLLPDFEVPETHVSFRMLVQVAEIVLRRQPTRLSGSLTAISDDFSGTIDPHKFKLTLYTAKGDTDRTGNPFVVELDAKNPQELFAQVSEYILRQVNPYIFASYTYDTHHREKALTLLDEMISHQTDLKWAYLLRGEILREHQDYDKAIASYKLATAVDPKFADAYDDWGLALDQSGKPAEAIPYFQKAIGLQPKFAAPYDNWAVALDDLGRLDDAIAHYKKAIAVDPSYAATYDDWGVTLADRGRYAEAIALYQKTLSVDPTFADAYDSWGDALVLQSKYPEAVALYQKTIEIDPEYAAAYVSWGSALEHQGKFGEAIPVYQKAIAIDPQKAAPYAGLGNALCHQGKCAEAATFFQKAYDIDPKDADRLEQWAEALRKLGRTEEARQKHLQAEKLQHAQSDSQTQTH
jgi:tetratricopeptide (TPR) repeat protein